MALRVDGFNRKSRKECKNFVPRIEAGTRICETCNSS